MTTCSPPPGRADPPWHGLVAHAALINAHNDEQRAPALEQHEPQVAQRALSLEQAVRARHGAGHSQRAIARELSIDRRKVKQIIERAA